jgi:hypothetical protein
MSAQRKTLEELADMIAAWLNVWGVQVSVRPDPVAGWHPVIVAARSSPDKYQRSADFVASRDVRRAHRAAPGNICLRASR